ncbi:MAG: transglycosylase domain-containing protein [Actinomycetota bacterium]|nr:transglycosylase domain-containing protein [Actinomycetota bacterium]
MEHEIRTIEKSERHRRRLPALLGIGVMVVVAATWIGLFGFLGANSAHGKVQSLSNEYLCNTSSIDLAFPNLSMLSTVHSVDGVLLGQLTERNSRPVSLDEMPDLVLAALLSAEDKSFYEHEGIDFSAILRAVIAKASGNSAGGGSTITQQVVKQNFLSDEYSIERKICEAVIAAELERIFTKDQILEFWANSVFFGSNAYGIRAASLEYFGKDLDELTISEAALLPIPIRNPTFYHPRKNAENALEARNRTIDRMAVNGYILPVDAREAKAEPLGIIAQSTFESLSPQVMIAVRQDLLRNNRYNLGETYAERKRAVFGCPAAITDCDGGGGLKINITLDMDLQEEANRILRAWFRPEFDGPTGAIATVDNATGAIKVLASGLDFGTDFEAGQRPYDLASQGARQSGSAFKPFTLAAALESGDRAGNPITLGSYWDDSSPAVIECDSPCSADGNFWTVRNAGGSSGKGLRTLASATYNSVNTVYARLVDAIGPEAVVDMGHRLGIESPLQPYPSITLGALGVSPLEMAAAYSTLANYGLRVEPYLIQRITASDGTVIYEHTVEPRQVVSDQVAAAVVGVMKQVVSNGTGTKANIGRPQAGKTGTATNYRDVWYVGYVPQMTTSVWVGYPDAQIPLEGFTVWNDLEGHEQFYRRAFGGTLPAPIWKQFMLYATQDMAPVDFAEEPQGTSVYRQTPFTTVPVLEESVVEMVDALFAVGLSAETLEVNSAMPAGSLIGTIPLPGTPLRQGSTVTVEVSNGVAPVITMIDLRGLRPIQVGDRLSQFALDHGLSITWSLEEIVTSNPTHHGVVVTTTPRPGDPVSGGQNIVVKIGKSP